MAHVPVIEPQSKAIRKRDDNDKENVGRKRVRKDSENLRSPPSSATSSTVLSRVSTFSSVCSDQRAYSSRSNKRNAPFHLLHVIDFPIDDPLRTQPHVGTYDRASIVHWMMETSEAFTLTCETLHLSVNYLDRCLAKLSTIDKKQTQILATACLYVASKLEEVYPPNMDEFAYVADHLCKPHHIANQEIEILLTLEWKMRMTPASACLNYMCQCYDMSKENRYMSDDDFSKQPPEVRMPSRRIFRRVTSMAPAIRRFVTVSQTTYDTRIFVDSMKVLNLAILDRSWSRFSGMTLAASVLRLVTGEQLSHVPNLRYNEYARCVHWMQPFYEVMKAVPAKTVLSNIDRKHKMPATHRIQRCEATLALLKEAHALKPHDLARQSLANIGNRGLDLRPLIKRRRLQDRDIPE